MHVIQAYKCLLTDVSTLSGVRLHAPDSLDMNWVRIDGPQLEKSVLQYLEHGTQCPFPEWLQPLWDRFVLEDNPVLLRYIRQLLLFGYKAEEPYNEDQLTKAVSAFVACDEGLSALREYFIYSCRHSGPIVEARKLVSRVISRANFSDITPSHGPGAVYPSCAMWDKSDFRTVYSGIEEYYPYFDYFAPQGANLFNYIDHATHLEQVSSIRAKLVAVPKDSRGPRLICVHPKEAVWIQQGIRQVLERAITQHPLTRGKIVFDDQTTNQGLAIQGSLDGSYATLDLKDASDRLEESVVEYLFGAHYRYFKSCRADTIQLPTGGVMPLNKYAPMGNATVFPVQSLCFWAMVTAGVHARFGSNATPDVHVFGDDIIVRSEYAECARETLIRFGLVPNQSKCFHKGSFRESCGADAYKGIIVTPLRLKRYRGSSYSTLESLCDLAARLRRAGYEFSSSYMYSYVRSTLRTHWNRILPLCNDPHGSGLYEWVRMDPFRAMSYNPPSFTRWNRSYHRWEVRTFQRHTAKRYVVNHDWYHVLDGLLGANLRPIAIRLESDNSDGLYYPDPRRNRLQCGWTPFVMSSLV